MAFWRRTTQPEPALVRLHRRAQHSVDRQDPRGALENAALAEATDALGLVLERRSDAGELLIGALSDVIAIHYLRAGGLHSAEDTHAFVAVAGWIHAVNPGDVPPQVRQEVVEAIRLGAETDEPTATLRALQGHASAVRAAWRRNPDRALADTFVTAFARLLDYTSVQAPEYPTRLLDLAAAKSSRDEITEWRTDTADLDDGIALTDQALAHPHATTATIQRSHQLRGPMLIARLERNHDPADLERAQTSLQALVDLAPDQDSREQAEEDAEALRRLYLR